MEFNKLLEPYSEGGLRTVEGQIKWLQTKQIPKVYIDKAVLFVYDELDRGKRFPNGHELDQYLFKKAREFWDTEVSSSVETLEKFFQGMKEKWKEDENRLKKANRSPLQKVVDMMRGSPE